ncbi:MAG: hypothetical protein JO225_00410 [Candidatus Eremiobacteraeota bacterium]|nr:hypothetical protein [Candidatus Eremiobacteraeota bacterium]
MQRSIVLALAACLSLAAPSLAQADQDDNSYYANEHRVVGRVISSEPWNLQLDRGPHIILHPGTVINPTGLTLRNGMPVRVYGHITADGKFSADQIDLLPPGPPPWEFRRPL